jgi:hypothetical protein
MHRRNSFSIFSILENLQVCYLIAAVFERLGGRMTDTSSFDLVPAIVFLPEKKKPDVCMRRKDISARSFTPAFTDCLCAITHDKLCQSCFIKIHAR